jgi:hypothetical protein
MLLSKRLQLRAHKECSHDLQAAYTSAFLVYDFQDRRSGGATSQKERSQRTPGKGIACGRRFFGRPPIAKSYPGGKRGGDVWSALATSSR